ncbi:hypothetical protein L211DRAFT_842092 [Terfezia boudieri ATCC MYA-4762]|uniref:PQ loop repeat protein n=1 Tax=Terfezia boudieri ATCC MYA-4762 TaxID=1051890 RepID=A0A3N4LED4_9PEZI|nr:hypothetical protein L211DRAFT_842092 [Terfezia boudieri ATCC MYA-4762]
MFNWFVNFVAPLFIVTSPITSYADQIRSIHINKCSQGFSLDTPLIMLVASILRSFYWLGARYETSLLIQSLIMIVIQLLLLKVALDHRPPHTHPASPLSSTPPPPLRPYHFWQWGPQKPYWDFLLLFTLGTFTLQLLLGSSATYTALQGFLALGVEATLPIPQVLQNYRAKSCNGFRFSVLASWILGDIMKQVFFFSAEKISLQFKLCAGFQMLMDLVLGWQFWRYGNGRIEEKAVEKLEMGRF